MQSLGASPPTPTPEVGPLSGTFSDAHNSRGTGVAAGRHCGRCARAHTIAQRRTTDLSILLASADATAQTAAAAAAAVTQRQNSGSRRRRRSSSLGPKLKEHCSLGPPPLTAGAPVPPSKLQRSRSLAASARSLTFAFFRRSVSLLPFNSQQLSLSLSFLHTFRYLCGRWASSGAQPAAQLAPDAATTHSFGAGPHSRDGNQISAVFLRP